MSAFSFLLNVLWIVCGGLWMSVAGVVATFGPSLANTIDLGWGGALMVGRTIVQGRGVLSLGAGTQLVMRGNGTVLLSTTLRFSVGVGW